MICLGIIKIEVTRARISQKAGPKRIFESPARFDPILEKSPQIPVNQFLVVIYSFVKNQAQPEAQNIVDRGPISNFVQKSGPTRIPKFEKYPSPKPEFFESVYL